MSSTRPAIPRRLTRFRIEILRETSLLGRSTREAEAFARVWERLGIGDDWRARCFLECDGGLFLKGNQIPALCGPQMWMRRFHIGREFRTLRTLRERGLPIPEPVAMGIERRGKLPLRAFLLERRIRPALDLEQLLRSGESLAPAARRASLRRAGEAVRRMHAAGVAHGDLACRNLLVRLRETDVEVFLLDLPRARLARGRLSARWRRKDLYRLAKSALRCGATDEDLTLLIGAAVGGAPDALIDATRSIRSVRNRPARKIRLAIWRALGA